VGKHSYKNDRIEVTWDKETCIHAAECIKNLNQVFDTSKNPWINVDAAKNEEIMAAIKTCPSGALQYFVNDQSDDSPETQVTIVVAGNSAYRISGNVRLEDADGNEIETRERFSLCRCGASQNKPFCDGSHKSIGFEG